MTDSLSSSQQQLSIILVCSGRGSDYKSYRPNLDQSQWWMRRDALVRCVCAALFGPRRSSSDDVQEERNGNHNGRSQSSSVELILLFDEDLTIMKMTLRNPSSSKQQEQLKKQMSAATATTMMPYGQPPLERNVIAAWRRVTSSLNHRHHHDNNNDIAMMLRHGETPSIEVTCLRDPWRIHNDDDAAPPLSKILTKENNSDETTTTTKEMSRYSKRDLLHYIQNNASVDDLRRYRLNSSSDVILRKVNRTLLVKVFLEIQAASEKKKTTDGEEMGQENTRRRQQQLENIFSSLLNPSSSHQNMAVLLHENCQTELPIFGLPSSPFPTTPTKTFIILGAVRDMNAVEISSFRSVCRRTDTPLAECHLGKTVEFTSKIVTACVCHFLVGGNNRFRRAVERAATMTPPMEVGDDGTGVKARRCLFSSTSPRRRCLLHHICIVPIPSTALTVELSQRNLTLWSLVRVCVTSLWRSRLASKDGDNAKATEATLENILTLHFLNGLTIRLSQYDFVKRLAEKHQAAPTEYQVLNALKDVVEEEERRRGDGVVKGHDDDLWLSLEGVDRNYGGRSRQWALDFSGVDEGSEDDGNGDNISRNKNGHNEGEEESFWDIVYNHPCDCSDGADDKNHDNNVKPNDSSSDDDDEVRVLRVILRLPTTEHNISTLILPLTSTTQPKPNTTISSIITIHQNIKSHLQSANIPLLPKRRTSNVILDCWDRCGVIVTMFQHFHYHNRLFPSLDQLQREELEKKKSRQGRTMPIINGGNGERNKSRRRDDDHEIDDRRRKKKKRKKKAK